MKPWRIVLGIVWTGCLVIAVFADRQHDDGARSHKKPAELPKLFRQKEFTCAMLAEAVNHYVDVGEKAAIEELESKWLDSDNYQSGFRRSDRVGWICRIIFLPKGHVPLEPPRRGALELPMNYEPIPEVLKAWPLYPVAASGESYFVLAEGYRSRGRGENISQYVEYCRKHGKFQRKRTPVPTRAQALHDAKVLRQSPQWKAIRWSGTGENRTYSFPEESVWDFIKAQATNIPASHPRR